MGDKNKCYIHFILEWIRVNGGWKIGIERNKNNKEKKL